VTELQHCVSNSALQLRADTAYLSDTLNPHVNRIISKQINFGTPMPETELVEIAEAYHLLYEQTRAERFEWLNDSLEEMGRPESVVAMIFCSAYYPFFENWLASCSNHNIKIKNRTVCFALDHEAYKKATAQGIKAYFLNPDLYGDAGDAGSFADKRFGRTMFYKNAVVRDLLELGVNVLFQDVDLIWLRDPFDYLHLNNSSDITFMYDGANPIHQPLYANSGFFFARVNDACKALFDTALGNTASIFRSGSHQKPLNRILGHFVLHNVLKLKILPESLFLNGHLFNSERGIKPEAVDWRGKGCVVHYSWSVNRVQKLEKMNQFGFSYTSL
jgi:rhamnogalacturonan II specific xylosyltransferase